MYWITHILFRRLNTNQICVFSKLLKWKSFVIDFKLFLESFFNILLCDINVSFSIGSGRPRLTKAGKDQNESFLLQIADYIIYSVSNNFYLYSRLQNTHCWSSIFWNLFYNWYNLAPKSALMIKYLLKSFLKYINLIISWSTNSLKLVAEILKTTIKLRKMALSQGNQRYNISLSIISNFDQKSQI